MPESAINMSMMSERWKRYEYQTLNDDCVDIANRSRKTSNKLAILCNILKVNCYEEMVQKILKIQQRIDFLESEELRLIKLIEEQQQGEPNGKIPHENDI